MKHSLQKNILFLLLFTAVYSMSFNSVKASPLNVSPVRILFIGNSSTYYNNMPLMIKGLANADGIEVEVETVTASNYKLSQFAADGNLYNTKIKQLLSEKKFDYVILQDHRASIIENMETSKDAVSVLKELIQQYGAETILYETQADYTGKDFTIDGTLTFLDHTTLQYYMTKNYYFIGNLFNCTVSTAGVNYTRCMTLYPEINLYHSDLHHPSIEGSYLAACTLYQSIFSKSAYNNHFLPGSEFDTDELLTKLEYDTAKKLQAISDDTLKLSSTTITVNKGKSQNLSAFLQYTPENPLMHLFTNKIEYYSLDGEKAAVNRNTGNVTGLRTGDTMIMATTDSGLMSMCSVSIKQPSIAFTIAEGTTYLHRKDTQTYTTSLSPSDTTDAISWISSKPNIVSVDANGKITAKKIGTATITATTDSGITLKRSVRVKLVTPTKVKVKKLSTNAKSKKYANIKISWKKNTNAVKYYIYRSTKKGSGYKKIATTTTASYTDKNKKKGRTFYYKIRSIYSNTKCNSYRTKGYKIKVS